ncbi:hypothetical protein QAD02_014626 [Eretmocerus hayati]|uniref:Uncharacterized protein n=1 Tax=Eretmocerus hayati TaxID=131215 RepID=A0ACC2P6E4_9HYME|nr:hypothetical protein QAD02_014626 [Eretmocerus hayati]
MWSQKLTHCDPWISSSAIAADDSYSLPFQDNSYVDPGFGIRDLNATPTVLFNGKTSHRRFDQYKNHVDGNADYLPDNGILRSESHNILEIGALRFPANFAAADPDEIRHNPTQEQANCVLDSPRQFDSLVVSSGSHCSQKNLDVSDPHPVRMVSNDQRGKSQRAVPLYP